MEEKNGEREKEIERKRERERTRDAATIYENID